MAVVIKAIANSSSSSTRGGDKATGPTNIRGQVMLGAIAAGQLTQAGGQAHGGDRDRRVGAGTTKTSWAGHQSERGPRGVRHPMMREAGHVGTRFNQECSPPKPPHRRRIQILMEVMIAI